MRRTDLLRSDGAGQMKKRMMRGHGPGPSHVFPLGLIVALLAKRPRETQK